MSDYGPEPGSYSSEFRGPPGHRDVYTGGKVHDGSGRTQPPIMLPVFEGTTSLDQFLDEFEEAANHFQWDEPQKFYYIKNRLKGAPSKLVWAKTAKML